jgi:hypothetical protein
LQDWRYTNHTVAKDKSSSLIDENVENDDRHQKIVFFQAPQPASYPYPISIQQSKQRRAKNIVYLFKKYSSYSGHGAAKRQPK